MMGFPLEIFTMLGSGLLTGVLKLASQNEKRLAAERKHELALTNLQLKATSSARTHVGPTKSTGFHWTRRTIALMCTFAILVFPKLAAVFWPDVGIAVSYTQWVPGMIWGEGKDVVKWIVMDQGLVITPLDTHTVMAILGMFFGAEVAKRK